MKSCLYSGRVFHRRYAPFDRRFEARLGLLYLDLAELDRVFSGSWLFGMERAAPASFRRRDHFGDSSAPLADVVRRLATEALGREVPGAIRLLTLPRYFGYAFNPASFYYCFGEADEIEAVVVEVTNTPWLERHTYVLDARSGGPVSHAKEFHVSPFLGMDHDYNWRIQAPGERLGIAVENRRDGALLFEVGLALERSPLGPRALRRHFLRDPLQSFRVVAQIYGHAGALWWRGAPFHAHPRRRRDEELRA